ncbi:MAG: hypothetical protein G01um101419_485 [Parcubacteria group bacterium Gr01-1014_19]|nr:MAG: hypothetical protein G01um101419_485 [Parcubacteria group bacterium Gr01-1014_19]
MVTQLKKKAVVQQKLMVLLKLAIFRNLRRRRNERVNYWDLCEELATNLRVPDKLDPQFKDVFETAIRQLDEDKMVYKTWAASEGGVVIYPYKSGRKSVAQRAAADRAIVKLIQAVQYG